VAFDLLVRHLSRLGLEVTYVRNYTDVDDKIIARAHELGLNWKELTETYITSFEEDMAALNCMPPTHTPKATEYIKPMLEDILEIQKRGLAYQVDGDVYFNVSASENYGRLSHRHLEEQEAGSRVAVDSRKKNPGDFALWKAAKPGEPAWPGPFGSGRPGWHIECSTMSDRLLGAAFDIHGGGQDLIFPHQENELAQSAALNRPMATIWTHNGFVNVNNEKMSKSGGNFRTIKEILKETSPEVLRYFLISKHYRVPIEFSAIGLKDAEKALERIYRTVTAVQEFINKQEPPVNSSEYEPSFNCYQKFYQALDDDLNTAKALGFLFDLLHLLNTLVTKNQVESVFKSLSYLFEMGNSLGLKLSDPKEFFDSLKKEKNTLNPSEIEDILQKRKEARANKDYAESDRLRNLLRDHGLVVEDK
jgi:cysteinyl-tRNA synthetase